ncbi:MAG: 4a-hydroxytetrahydrobiopterin dehydratase [Oleibacter sp.]|nr:4a-hydroxytetrahydrobiopterin dehydratase [Thalassolituus sp.]
MSTKKLSPVEIADALDQLNRGVGAPWQLNDDHISKEFKFSDFTAAFSFMTRCAFAADKADHHPEWTNVYNKVSVTFTTHDVGGLTEKDFDVAGTFNKFADS